MLTFGNKVGKSILVILKLQRKGKKGSYDVDGGFWQG